MRNWINGNSKHGVEMCSSAATLIPRAKFQKHFLIQQFGFTIKNKYHKCALNSKHNIFIRHTAVYSIGDFLENGTERALDWWFQFLEDDAPIFVHEIVHVIA